MSRLLDALIGAGLRLCDWIAGPMPETEADRIQRRSTIPLVFRRRWRD